MYASLLTYQDHAFSGKGKEEAEEAEEEGKGEQEEEGVLPQKSRRKDKKEARQEKPFLCEHICENLPGSFQCRCHPGYKRDPSDPRRCVDRDECTEGLGGGEEEEEGNGKDDEERSGLGRGRRMASACATDGSEVCVNLPGSYACSCAVGYRLEKITGAKTFSSSPSSSMSMITSQEREEKKTLKHVKEASPSDDLISYHPPLPRSGVSSAIQETIDSYLAGGVEGPPKGRLDSRAWGGTDQTAPPITPTAPAPGASVYSYLSRKKADEDESKLFSWNQAEEEKRRRRSEEGGEGGEQGLAEGAHNHRHGGGVARAVTQRRLQQQGWSQAIGGALTTLATSASTPSYRSSSSSYPSRSPGSSPSSPGDTALAVADLAMQLAHVYGTANKALNTINSLSSSALPTAPSGGGGGGSVGSYLNPPASAAGVGTVVQALSSSATSGSAIGGGGGGGVYNPGVGTASRSEGMRSPSSLGPSAPVATASGLGPERSSSLLKTLSAHVDSSPFLRTIGSLQKGRGGRGGGGGDGREGEGDVQRNLNPQETWSHEMLAVVSTLERLRSEPWRDPPSKPIERRHDEKCVDIDECKEMELAGLRPCKIDELTCVNTPGVSTSPSFLLLSCCRGEDLSLWPRQENSGRVVVDTEKDAFLS